MILMIRHRYIGFLLMSVVSVLFSCQKETTPPPNAVPVVNAGAPQTITLPVDSVTLSGTASDPDGHIVAFLWSQVSGPAPSVIVNPGSATTKVRGLRQGLYIFQLMATDNDGATGVDTTSVIVNPSPIQTLTLQPANNPYEFLIGNHNGLDISGSNRPDLVVEAWTSGGTPFTCRGVIKFDLSSIPNTATVLSANLYLYSYPTPTLNGNFIDANFGIANSMLIQQITSNWSPATINWFNQPVTTTANQIVVPHTAQSILDLNLDVKSIVSSMVTGNSNFGFYLKLQSEAIYNSRIFVASYNTTHTTKYPKLVVVYQ